MTFVTIAAPYPRVSNRPVDLQPTFVPRQPSRSRRLTTAASWPVGIGLTSWDYMWRTTPLHRIERIGGPDRHRPPPLPTGVSHDDVQGPDDGVGPVFHRRYRGHIRDSDLSPDDLVERICADPNVAAPTQMARFVKVAGDEGGMAVGDEYVVRMPGPWDGPVRVVDRTPTSFRFATLVSHLEAGQIEFRASRERDELVFTIESWANSGDRLSRILYQQLRMAKEVQLHMWASFIERAARLAGGRLGGGVEVETVRVDDRDVRSVGDPAARRVLDTLHAKGPNFDVEGREEHTPEHGWKVDHYLKRLPPEPPGPPVADGSWETARRLMHDYEFADPSMVTAIYDADEPLAGRDMLLEARWHGLRFDIGVRVGGVTDETRDVDGRQVRLWGWNYRTLQGHLEMGQMDYEVWKWLDDGTVEFRVHRFSRRASVGNPVVRAGLRLFGRREQVRFARRACGRMARLTADALERGPLE